MTVPISTLTMTVTSGRLPYSMLILTGKLANLMSADLLTLWDLRIEEQVDAFFLINFKAKGPKYKAAEMPLGISAVGSGSGSFKKVSAIENDGTESY